MAAVYDEYGDYLYEDDDTVREEPYIPTFDPYAGDWDSPNSPVNEQATQNLVNSTWFQSLKPEEIKTPGEANALIKAIESAFGKGAATAVKGAIFNKDGKTLNLATLATGAAGLYGLLGGNKIETGGYNKPIPKLTATREQIPYAADPNRRPGEAGRSYFTDTQFTAPADAAATQAAAKVQAQGIASAVPQRAAQVNPYEGQYKPAWNSPAPTTQPLYEDPVVQNPPGPASDITKYLPVPRARGFKDYEETPVQQPLDTDPQPPTQLGASSGIASLPPQAPRDPRYLGQAPMNRYAPGTSLARIKEIEELDYQRWLAQNPQQPQQPQQPLATWQQAKQVNEQLSRYIPDFLKTHPTQGFQNFEDTPLFQDSEYQRLSNLQKDLQRQADLEPQVMPRQLLNDVGNYGSNAPAGLNADGAVTGGSLGMQQPQATPPPPTPTSGLATLAQGGLAAGGFVVPADVVAHLGNGSSSAGLALLAEKLNAKAIKGKGDGMSDSIPTHIDGKEKALVANDEAYIDPNMVKRIGGGNTKSGADKLLAMMERIRKARTGNPKQGKRINPEKFMPGGLRSLNMGGSIQTLQAQGRGGDTMLAHINPQEAQMLKAMGGSGGINPNTGLREFMQGVDRPINIPAATPGPLSTPAATPLGTSTSSSLSPWAGDYVTNYLGKGQALAEAPYQSYGGPLTAGASNLQNQAFAGIGAAAQEGYKPTTYQGGTFDATQAQNYMNPYLSAALNPQLDEMRRQADITRTNDAGRMTRAGAYGGSRQGVLEAAGNEAMARQQNQAIGTGYQTAYDKAMQQFNTEQDRRLGAEKSTEASRQYSADYGLKSLGEAASLGAVQRGMETEGIAADRQQFEEQRDYPLKMVQYQKDLLQGLPITTAATTANTTGVSQISDQIRGLTGLYNILAGLGTTDTAKPAA